MIKGAVFSACRTYRYALWRTWEMRTPSILFVGLNPSTADDQHDDPTIRRCIRFAQNWGYGGIYVANLFSFRATRPTTLKANSNPIGSETEDWIHRLSQETLYTIACWGNHGSFLQRNQVITQMIANLYCLRITKQGQPAHPLYLPNNLTPIPYPPLSTVKHLSSK